MIKTKKNSGESLIETMISILICVLGVLAVTTAIVQSGKMTAKGNEKLNSYYEQNNELTEQSSPSETGTVSIEQNGNKTVIVPEDEEDYEVEYFINDVLGGSEIISYRAK